jgi:DNA-binding transcriptional ArsR family regulator
VRLTTWESGPRTRPGYDPAGRLAGRLRLEPASASAILNQMVQSQMLDRTFSALSDPTRRHILERLSAGPASISELARPYRISLPGVMKHVRILEEANLVTTEKHGRTRECRLGPGSMDDATRWIHRYRRHWEHRLDRLETVIQRRKGATS